MKQSAFTENWKKIVSSKDCCENYMHKTNMKRHEISAIAIMIGKHY